MLGNRPSSLPVTQYCGLAGQLGAKTGTGRAALQSSYLHAVLEENADRAFELKSLMTEEEIEEADSWGVPTEVHLRDFILRIADGHRECPVTAYRHNGTPWYEGTPDVYWVVDNHIYVLDYKRSSFTSSDGPESLQLAAYGFALCAKHKCSRYTPIVWALDVGEYTVGETVDVTSFDSIELAARLENAVNNVNDEPFTGPHCSNCYARVHCHAWSVEALRDTWLEELTKEAPDPEAAGELLQRMNDLEKLFDHAKERIKALAASGARITHGDKRYIRISCRGRTGLDKKALEKDHPDIVAKYTGRGKPYSMWRLV